MGEAGASLAKSFTQILISKLRELDGAPRTVAQICSAKLHEADEISAQRHTYTAAYLTALEAGIE